MKDASDTPSGSGRGPGDRPDSNEERFFEHRWHCPFCETTRVLSADSGETHPERVSERAQTALRSHVLASVGDGHGPRNEFDDGFDPSALDDYVEPLDVWTE